MENSRLLNLSEAVDLLRRSTDPESIAFVQDYDECEKALAENEARCMLTVNAMFEDAKRFRLA